MESVMSNIADAVKSALDAKAKRTKKSKSAHPDGPVTFDNVEVTQKGSLLTFSVDLDKISMRGDKVNTSKISEDKDGNLTGGSVMLASYNRPFPTTVSLGSLGGEKHSLRINMNVTVQPN